MPTRQTHPIVLRMAGMFPKDLGGYEGHRRRKGGDLGVNRQPIVTPYRHPKMTPLERPGSWPDAV
ncbi:hypothetical protein [Salipiger bermudensis]|uniref:hypothetical protein n=1 Tax=Salipiger bermudensis TaxID=344736 RepID=UPI001A906851|nr:hypothetical protein [Salipiger bermudensis]MBN9678842.1 hypothetical protein [Salipiger bermudensis]